MEKEHLEILLEDIRRKFDLVLEGHEVLQRQITNVYESLNDKIEMNTLAINALNHNTQMNNLAINALNNKIDTVHDSLDEKIEKNSLAIDALNKKIDTVHDSLNEKIEKNSTAIVALNNKIDNVHDSLNDKIESVEKRLTKKIDAVATDLAAHRADTESHSKTYRVSERE